MDNELIYKFVKVTPKTDIKLTDVTKLTEKDILDKLDTPIYNLGDVREYIFFKNKKIKNKQIINKLKDIALNNNDKYPWNGYKPWQIAENCYYLLTGEHTERYFNATEHEKWSIDRFNSH